MGELLVLALIAHGVAVPWLAVLVVEAAASFVAMVLFESMRGGL